MISFLSPYWLVLLTLIPAIRWLHRFRHYSVTFLSSTLFLWNEQVSRDHAGITLSSPDPRWYLRAIIFTLLLMALAQPGWNRPEQLQYEAWIDDSLSMFTLEQGATRLQQGLDQLRDYLERRQASSLIIHSLSDPSRHLRLARAGIDALPQRVTQWIGEPGISLRLAPVTSLGEDSHHVLVSDGADPQLQQWTEHARLHHLVQPGRSDHNLALTGLSVRRTPDDSDRILGISRLDNLSSSSMQAALILEQGTRLLKRIPLELEPGSYHIEHFSTLTISGGNILARIESEQDILSADNRLQLNANVFQQPIAYRTQGDCAPYIKAALDANPNLDSLSAPPALLIDCTEQHTGPATEMATLRLHTADKVSRTSLPAHWHVEGADYSLALPAGLPLLDSAPALSSALYPMLSAGGKLLLQRHHGEFPLIESFVDFADPQFARSPQYPILLHGLISDLLQHGSQLSPSVARREISASRIKPRKLPFTLAAEVKSALSFHPLTQHLLLAAILFLLVDTGIAFKLFKRASA